jgi:2-polyprenyl-6-methoxyphenol hydroxylase-like FAD-dependent oxidoreductase
MAKGHAEIAGAGVAGLIAATALAQRGWTVRVHERAPDLRNFGAGISCWYNFAKCLKAVGAYEQAIQNSRPFYIRETRDERNRVLYTIAAEPARAIQTFSLTRRDLSFALANAARRHGVEIVTSSKGVSAAPGGELVVDGGQRYRADLVVAADGVNSSIRDGLGLLSKRLKLGDGAVRMLIPRIEEERHSEDGKKGIEYWSGARRLYYTANNAEEIYLAFMVPTVDVEARAVPIRKDVWIKSFPYLRSLIERVGDEGRWDEFEQISLHSWSSGRVAVVGDAAAAMAPNIGQGGGFAAVNALALAVCVSQARTVEGGLAEWERRQRPITEYTQRVSYWYGRMNDLPPLIRAQLIKWCGRSKWLVNIRQRPANLDPLGYVAEA